jgi:CobQ-like glutamine amidotransferase family enzyme
MTDFQISIGYLYPDIMCAYGDRGNVGTVLRRCAWRGIDTRVCELHLGDRVEAAELDLLVVGSGERSHQQLIAGDLATVKGPGIRDAVAQGSAMLAVGGGYELLGRFCQPVQGEEIPGAALFDTWTVDSGAHLGQPGTITEARSGRAIGDLVVRWGDELLIGFENHSGRTYLGPTAQPLGRVLIGHGNNGDGHEGVILDNAVGTYMRGPCLPRNPALTDFLIRAALIRRYGHAELPPLPDQMEHAAHQVALQRLQAHAPPTTRALTQRLARLSGVSRRSRADLNQRQLDSTAAR